MIERYTLPEMGNIWTDEAKYENWMKVEIAVCEVLSSMGRIPKAAVAEIKRKACFSVKRIEQLEAKTNHDVNAFLDCLKEKMGPCTRYIHVGMTSTDLVDTAQGLQLAQAGKILINCLADLKKAVGKQARKYRRQPMVGGGTKVVPRKELSPFRPLRRRGFWIADSRDRRLSRKR